MSVWHQFCLPPLSTAMPEYVKPEILQENRIKYVKVAIKDNDLGKFTGTLNKVTIKLEIPKKKS